LSRRVAAHTTPVRAARRARIVLMAADGVPSRQISQRVGMHESNVAKWRNRFRDKGLEGLEDRPRPGGPKRFGHDERMKVAAAATSERDPDDPVSTWTYFDLAQKLWAEGVEISVSQLWRILTDMDIRLNRVRGWLNRRDDPTFWERVRDVSGLYLNPPERALVLSVDEKTSMQAKERKHPDQVVAPGRPRRREFDYVRHGTASLVAALAVHTGKVVDTPIERNNSENFCAFLETIEASIDRKLKIHVILDNGLQPRLEGDQSMVRRRSPLGRPLHPSARQLGEPDRALLFDPAAKSDTQRQLPFCRGPHRQAHGLHQRLRPDRHTLRLDLRRQPIEGRMNITNHTRGIPARQH
jgi:transposase